MLALEKNITATALLEEAVIRLFEGKQKAVMEFYLSLIF
jgi:hypothetical protein